MNRKFSIFLKYLIGLSLVAYQASAQLPVSNFSMPSTACYNQKVIFANTSQNSVSYEWDFCEGDLSQAPTDNIIATLSGATNPEDMDMVYDGANWYAFVTGLYYANALYRLDFGATPNNSSPKVTSLGNPGNLLVGPAAIKVVQENGNWYAFVSNSRGNNLTRLSFGTSLTNNSPAAENIITSLNTGYFSMDIGISNNNSVIVMSNFNDNTLLMVNLGNSVTNNPSVSDLLTSSAVSGGVGLDDISLVRQGGNWYGFLVGFNSRSVHRLYFGMNLFSVPTITTINGPAFGPFDRPSGVQVKIDKAKFEGFVQTYSGAMYRMDLDSVTNDNPTNTQISTLSTLANAVNLKLVKHQSAWYGFVINTASAAISKINFPNNCSAVPAYSTLHDPPPIVYTSSGTYFISLRASANQDNAYTSRSLNVQNLPAPDISFSTQNLCANSNVNFLPNNQSGNLTGYQWDFGDGNNSSAASPSHSYSSASTYYPSLSVTASNSCQNFFQDTLQIFNPPQANFNLPVASPLCTNQNYTFTNNSTYDPGSGPIWQWAVNGSNVSTTQDLIYLFTSSASASVTLTAAIPGCSTQSTQNITTLLDGPLISFMAPAFGCMGSSVSFTNTTTDPVPNFVWSFGDGNSSSQTNASNTFNSSGNYVVNLSGTNANGCQNSYTKTILIYSIPQPDFVIASPQACEKSTTQFHNQTPTLVDSNISSWLWNFGDLANGSSSLKNPSYVYASANSYNVSLTATTNFGCTNTVQKLITVLTSPTANFTNSAACINQGTQFNDASQGNISLYQWNIQTSVLSGTAPTYTFKSSGSFPVTLTVTAANKCINQVTKNVVVPVKPLIDFSIEAPCTGHPSSLQEVNAGGADPAIFWNWNFGQDSGIGSPTSYQFPAEGGYTVTMSTTRQSGCVYSTSKNIYISPGPIAAFTPSVYAGAAPLDITFNNTSTADSYLWQFDDTLQTTSTNNSPEFVFTKLGKYKVLLTAFDIIHGCSDTLSTEIDVVVPHIDIVMNAFSLTNDPISNSSNAVVTILNSGNIPLVDPEVLIAFGGDAVVKQKVSGMVRPGKSLVQILGLQIVPRSLQYICAEIDVANDVNTYNNKRCISLSDVDVVLDPYPNPSSSGSVTLEWISAKHENVTVTIFKSDGQIVFQQELDEFQSGLGQMTINCSAFNSGIYLVQFSGGKTSRTFRIVISN